MELTVEQKKWIRSLQVVMGKAPKDLWMFVAAGDLCIMYYADPDTKKRLIRNQERGGGMDQDAMACTIATKMELDGGDW